MPCKVENADANPWKPTLIDKPKNTRRRKGSKASIFYFPKAGDGATFLKCEEKGKDQTPGRETQYSQNPKNKTARPDPKSLNE